MNSPTKQYTAGDFTYVEDVHERAVLTDGGDYYVLREDGTVAGFHSHEVAAAFIEKNPSVYRMSQAAFSEDRRLLAEALNRQVSEAGGDPVNSPSHYTSGGVETIDFIQAKLTPEQFEGYLLGNTLKYLARFKKKGDATEDAKKARWYLDKLISTQEGN